MNGGEIRVVRESQTTEALGNDNVFKMEWGVDSSSITPEMLERVHIPLQSDDAGIMQVEKVNLTFVACARYIDWAIKEMNERGLTIIDDHRVNWWRLLENFAASDIGKLLIEKSPKTKEELDKFTSRLGIEGEAIARIRPELIPLLTGQTDPLTHFVKDDLLFRVYHSDEGARPNQYIADYVKMLTFQKRDLRILEIGAGTGGTTYRILKACSPNGETFCSEYMYTDISSGFFEAVRTTRLKDWAHLLIFQTLDLEKDAASQGFKEHSYDLVVAANVVHTTRSLDKSIRTIHKLLKPSGILGLVELTTSTPYINMTFGSIPGWWAGVDEGRTDSPLQSAEQWNVHVQDSLEQHADQIQHAILEFIHTTERRIEKNESREYELMYRDRKLQIQRFVADNKLSKAVSTSSDVTENEETTFHQVDRRPKIHVEKPGLLNSLVFIDDDSSTLGPDDVEIKSYAWGLNFSDVFIALGQLPPTRSMVGESAGVITAVGSNSASQFKPGDRVTAMFGTPYASRTRTNRHLVHHIPDKLSFTDAASIPLTFSTAYYSLFDCANLRLSQTILIHSASGALGQVAIKIAQRLAQRLGATIFATVGSAAKRQLLVEEYGIPENHIFSSRTTDFAAGINRRTNGTGVDVVLNSLSGPMLHASWECVAAFGTFVEVGKTDISRRSQLSMKPFERNLRFMSVDLVGLSRLRPTDCQKLLQRIFADFDAGLFTPLTVTTMPIGDIEKAFRLMQSRKHTGKIVLEASDSSTVQVKGQPFRLRSDGTYIIVGGLGSLGKHLCRHLQEKGARHIALFTRQSFQDATKSEMEKELAVISDTTVRIITCDVGDANAVQQVAAEMCRATSMPQVRGILHGGMVLSDRTLSQITQKDFEIALLPKYHGTVNIYNSFYHKDVDFFANLSSLCGIVGTLGQSNYAAGGTYQDMFTHTQVSAGYTKFATIDFPLIKRTYTITQEHTHSLGRQGVQLLPIEAALPVVDYVISGKAFNDGNHQIAFGLDPQSFIDQTTPAGRVPPLVSHILSSHDRSPAHQPGQQDERTAEEKVVLASTIEEAEQLILSGEGENNEVVDMYVRNKWLRGRDWRPRLRNFFATLPGQDTARGPQAQQAAQLSLAAFAYKLALDAGTVKQDFYHEQALDMAIVYWLFSSNRTPALGCDGYDRFPGSDYIVAMKRGHAYKIPLTDSNRQTISYDKLKNTFEAIVQQTPEETNWTSLLTTANRDEWAKAREEILSESQSGRNYIKTIEESLFIVYLEDAAPETATGRADAFLLDDNSNRWLDKTLSFVVCRNGVSAIWGEHTMVDGTTFGGLIKALNTPAVEHAELSNNSSASHSGIYDDFTSHDGYTLANFTQTSYAASYLRQRKLPPKTVIQLLIQVAVRRLFGHNPSGAVGVISQRPFRGGRTDMIYVMTPPVEAFCAAAEDTVISGIEKRRLFLDAVKSHARLVALAIRGRGFRWHLMALREMLEPGEELPAFYKDEVFNRTSERPICTSFTEFGLPEMGRYQPHKEDVWVGVQVFEERVQFTVINGERRSAEFVEHLKAAGEIVRGIIEASAA
ncbi:hypothetical protein ACQKWADRAFT_331646 [Trichoderma austrokoningii]